MDEVQQLEGKKLAQSASVVSLFRTLVLAGPLGALAKMVLAQLGNTRSSKRRKLGIQAVLIDIDAWTARWSIPP
jgi:hypothetical protein